MTNKFSIFNFQFSNGLEIGNWKLVLFGIAWRLAILVLPWQTRWFRDASLAGWPWEQGRWAVYASWVLILAMVILGFPSLQRRGKGWSWIWIAPMVLLVLTLLTTLSRTATAQWWIQIFLLGTFVFTLRRARVSGCAIAFWLVLSLVPHAFIGIWQYAVQDAAAFKWLGMAAHSPKELGTSVVEYGAFRVLRAYGGFPHPNIFGGWLAVAIIAAIDLAARARDKWRAGGYALASALFACALVVTYARGAWIAAIIGVVMLVIVGARHASPLQGARADTRPAPTRQFLFVALFAALVTAGAVVASQRETVFARFDTGLRLEAKSLDVRRQSLADGWQMFLRHPLFGTGPNAGLIALSRITDHGSRPSTAAPLEPPHNAYLLALTDVGILGLAMIAFALFLGWRNRPRSMLLATCYLLPLLTLALFDHYPWSLWAGQALVAAVVLLAASSGDGRSQTVQT